MKTVHISSWDEFEDIIYVLISNYDSEDRGWQYFRGQANADWLLETSLERFCKLHHMPHPPTVGDRLIEVFADEAAICGDPIPGDFDEQDAFELMARHHGLPTATLVWTRSPYIALYFAMCDWRSNAADAAVFHLNGAIFHGEDEFWGIHASEDLWQVAGNLRALEQQAVFLHINPTGGSIESRLADHLVKYTVCTSMRWQVLSRLDLMGINHTVLMRDRDSAAVTAARRVVAELGDFP